MLIFHLINAATSDTWLMMLPNLDCLDNKCPGIFLENPAMWWGSEIIHEFIIIYSWFWLNVRSAPYYIIDVVCKGFSFWQNLRLIEVWPIVVLLFSWFRYLWHLNSNDKDRKFPQSNYNSVLLLITICHFHWREKWMMCMFMWIAPNHMYRFSKNLVCMTRVTYVASGVLENYLINR